MAGAAQQRYGALPRGTAARPGLAGPTRLLRHHPALVTQQAGFLARLEQELADRLTERPKGPDPLTALVMASCFVAAIRSAINFWLARQPGRPLSDVIGDALDRVTEIAGTPTA